MAATGNRHRSFFSSIVRNITHSELQPREGLIQILDLPTNLAQLDFDSLVGLQVPIYDGIHFCHAIFKKSAKSDLKAYLDTNMPAYLGSHTGQEHPKAKAFSKLPEFSTFCMPEMEEDFVLFCKVKSNYLIN